MTHPIDVAKEEFAAEISEAAYAAYGIKLSAGDLIFSIAYPDPSFGDLTTNIAFKIAKEIKQNPKDIAENIAKKAKGKLLVKSFTQINGYVNASLDEKAYAQLVIETVLEEGSAYGSSNTGKEEKVLVEYPSVNPTKPWHVGHLRNALLGDSISNLLAFSGYKVERENYIDDLGLQVAETVWGYKHLSANPGNKKFDQFLGEQYVEVNKRIKQDTEAVQNEIADILKKMEAGNTEEATLSRSLSEKCVRAQYETSFNYGIYNDVLMWESDIVKSNLLNQALALAEEKKAIEKISQGDYSGCVVLDLEKVKHLAKEFENPKEKYKVLIRSNGVATYAMKDFAFHLWKFGVLDPQFKFREFIERQPNGKPLYTSASGGKQEQFGNARKVINIIDMSQNHEQDTVRALVKLTDPREEDELVHIAYGKVRLEGRSLSGREGGWLGSDRNYTADDLLAETVTKTLEKTKESKKLNEGKIEEIAKKIAIAAIKFEYLRVAPEKEIIFSWSRALNLEENSGPYVLYTYARAKHILDKANYSKIPPTYEAYEHVGRGYGFELVKKIGMAGEVIGNAARLYKPNKIAEYLLDVASAFSKFYETEPVLKGGEAKEVRLGIVYATMRVLENALKILGIEPVEIM
ncbi:MAG: arginine--tRNA ligase [Candidatus Micrarchaeia archaeon]